MEDQKVLDLLKFACKTLQNGHHKKEDAKEAIAELLERVDDMAFEISGERIALRGRRTKTEDIAGCKTVNLIPELPNKATS